MQHRSENCPEYCSKKIKRSFEKTLDWYIQGTERKDNGESFWYSVEKNPTLNEVRGKIVLFNRYAANATKGIVAEPWRDNATFDISVNGGGNLKIQDEYKVPTIFNLNDKFHKIYTHLNAAQTGEVNDWYINFVSGTSAGAYPNNVAKDKIGQQSPMNPRLFDLLQSKSPGRFGTLLMDFPDDPLISTIISLNEDIGSVGK